MINLNELDNRAFKNSEFRKFRISKLRVYLKVDQNVEPFFFSKREIALFWLVIVKLNSIFWLMSWVSHLENGFWILEHLGLFVNSVR